VSTELKERARLRLRVLARIVLFGLAVVDAL
jgi:hypothetical protein